MKEAKIINVVETVFDRISIGELYQLYDEGKLITIPEFLQRKLLKKNWFANKYQNCKEYIASCWKGTCSFDSFSIMRLDDLIKTIIELQSTDVNVKKQEEYQKLHKQLEDAQDAGAVWVCMDGQSRIILGLSTYIKGEYSLGEAGAEIMLRIDDKKHNCLTNTPFPHLPKIVQNLLLNTPVPVNIVRNYYSLEDIIEALINKQKGFAWMWFQIAKQKGRFTLFTIRLIDVMKSKFVNNFKKNIVRSGPKMWNIECDGDQLMCTNLAYFLDHGSWPNQTKVEGLFQDKIEISDAAFERAQEYANLFMAHLGKTKSTIAPLINFVLLQELMSKPNNTQKRNPNPFLKRCGMDIGYAIKVPARFIDYLVKLHMKLVDSKTPHPASYINGEENKEGYKASNGAQDDLNIFRRMELLIENCDFDWLCEKGILEETEMGSRMPTQDNLLVAKTFKNKDNEEIFIADFPSYHRSHRESKVNGGINDFENLENELGGPNLSRGGENMNGYSPKVSPSSEKILDKHKKPKNYYNRLAKLPKVGSFILQNKFGPPVGKFKLSTGIYDAERFLDLQNCVADLYQQGRYQALLNLKEKKITSLQLLDVYENGFIEEDNWDTGSLQQYLLDMENKCTS